MSASNIAEPTGSPILIAAALLCRADGRMLLVRKRGTSAYMQPGGKIEPGEAPLAAVLREVREEVGLIIDSKDVVYLGAFTAPAANEPGRWVKAEVFRIESEVAVTPAGEIEEAVWIDPLTPGSIPLAPLTRDHVLPLQAASLNVGKGL